MIEEFFASWALFHTSYIAGWLVAALLAVVGIVVVARDQIFIGAAVSQASTLGIAVALWLEVTLQASGSFIASEEFHFALGVAFAIAAAIAMGRGGGAGHVSYEAAAGWVFLSAGSLAILIVSRTPHALEEVTRLGTSSLIGATRAEVVLLGTLLVTTILLLAWRMRALLLFVTDTEMAGAVGLRLPAWRVVAGFWLGAAVGLSLHVTGMAYTFACLVLPALAARGLVREMRTLFWVAPAIALGATATAFVLANAWDYPPGQVAVVILAVLAGLGRLARLRRSSASAA